MVRKLSRQVVPLVLASLAAPLAATDFLLVCPQCEDRSAKYLGAGEIFSRWSDSVIQWYYNPSQAPPPFDHTPTALSVILAAMSQWEGVCGIDFQFMGLTAREPQDFEDFTTVIGWAPIGVAGLGGGVADAPWEEYVRLGYWPMQEGFVAIHPGNFPDWMSDEIKRFNFTKLLVHELGHMLTLGHSDDTDSVMSANPYNSLFGVRPDDIAAVQALYGPPRRLRVPATFAPPPPHPTVVVLDHYFAVGTSWDDLVEIVEITDETPEQTLYFWVECQNLPSGEGQAYLVDPSGYPHVLWEADNQWPGVASGMGLQQIAIVKSLPGTWWYYWVIDGTTVVARSIPVNTTMTLNRAPEGSLELSARWGSVPLTVALYLEATDSEGDAVSAIWHVPGSEPWTTPVTGPISETFSFREPGVYEIFIELVDDAPRYDGAGEGYRELLPATVHATSPLPGPRHGPRRLRPGAR